MKEKIYFICNVDECLNGKIPNTNHLKKFNKFWIQEIFNFILNGKNKIQVSAPHSKFKLFHANEVKLINLICFEFKKIYKN